MALSFWQRPNSPDLAAALLLGRIVTIAASCALLYLAYRVYYIPDLRFAQGNSKGLLDNPSFVLSVFILVPAALLLLASTARIATCWIATIAALCVATLEGGAFLYNTLTPPAASRLVQTFEGSIEKSECGRIGPGCLTPNAHARTIGKVDGNVLFDAAYSVDEFGVRRSIAAGDKYPRPTFVAVFGDSNTFGMNVSDEQTLSGQIGKMACSTRPYNFGIRGGGTANMLAEFEENLTSRAIKGTAGYFIYVYNEGHVLRNVGSDQTLLFGKNFPAYDFDERGSVEYMGTLWTYRPLRNALGLLAQRSNVVQALNIHVLNFESDYHRRLTARILDRAAQLARDQFPNSQFVLLLAPDSKSGAEIAKKMLTKDVRVLDYTKLIDVNRTDIEMPDKHPTPIYHTEMARQIVKDLGLELRCPD